MGNVKRQNKARKKDVLPTRDRPVDSILSAFLRGNIDAGNKIKEYEKKCFEESLTRGLGRKAYLELVEKESWGRSELH